MKLDKFRRSQNVEDYRDPNKPVLPPELDEFAQSIADQMKITNSTMAADLGGDDVLPKKNNTIIYLKPQSPMSSNQPDRPAFNIPQEILLDSFRLLALEGVSFGDYVSVVEELISELIRQGLVSPIFSGIGMRETATNHLYIRSIDAVFSKVQDRLDKAEP